MSYELYMQVTGAINKLIKCEQSMKTQIETLPLMQRERWIRQLEPITDERMLMNRTLEKYGKRMQEQREREELFRGLSKSDLEKSDTSRIEQIEEQNESLKRSRTIVEEVTSAGINILRDLGSQRDLLKAVHRRILDLGVLIGVSHSTLTTAERRNLIDKWLVYGGMCFVTLLLLVIIYYKFWRS